MDDPELFDEPVKVPIEGSIDLHAFAPEDIPSVVEAYLEAAAEAGLREVRIIHGRGKGVQKEVVRQVVAGHPGVECYAEAPPERGGWGATLVWLKKGAREAPDSTTE